MLFTLEEQMEIEFLNEINNDFDEAIFDVMSEGYTYEESLTIINEFLANFRAKIAKNHQVNQAHRDMMKRAKVERNAREAAENEQRLKDQRNNLLTAAQRNPNRFAKDLGKTQKAYEKAQKKTQRKESFFGKFLNKSEKRAAKNENKVFKANKAVERENINKKSRLDNKISKLSAKRAALAESQGLTEYELLEAMCELEGHYLNSNDYYYSDLII